VALFDAYTSVNKKIPRKYIYTRVLKMKNKKILLIGIALILLFCNISVIGAENIPTIRMGDNAPMSRDEFIDWSRQNGFRYFNIDGRLYPAGIFFNFQNGKAFSYGELNGDRLNVVHRPNIVSENRIIYAQDVTVENEESKNFSQIIFTDRTPILFSDDELTAMIESVPHQNPLDTRSAIMLPRRKLSESELAAWINEYNEMGGVTTFELSVVREINRVRAAYGLNPLALDPSLMMSARLKTQEFGDLQYFAHRSPIHGSPTESAKMFGFDGWGVAETITQSGSNGEPVFRSRPEGIVSGMLASSRGHKEILLNPNTFSMGFGSFFSPNSTGRNGDMSHMFYFATKFGFH
jgi:uncharacterized protein YkwD